MVPSAALTEVWLSDRTQAPFPCSYKAKSVSLPINQYYRGSTVKAGLQIFTGRCRSLNVWPAGLHVRRTWRGRDSIGKCHAPRGAPAATDALHCTALAAMRAQIAC